jgi:hypothetical protein
MVAGCHQSQTQKEGVTMYDAPAFKCTVCHADIINPTWCLNRNTQKFGTGLVDGLERVTITMLDSSEMFRYDSVDCWKVHEPSIAKELKLKSTYPDSSSITPCCRCGLSVDRYQPHVSYSVMAANLTETPDGWDAEVLNDREFAVLCPRCEQPDAPAIDAKVSIPEESQQHRART